MSELRKVSIPADDQILAQVGRELGLVVEHDVRIRGYSTKGYHGSTVIRGQHYDIGIVRDGKGKKRIIYDNMCEEADLVMEKYMDKYITRKLHGRIASKKSTNRQMIYLINA